MDGTPWDALPEELGPLVADVLASPAVSAVLEALGDVGPEAARHLVRAGQELLLAAQVLLDAAGAILEDGNLGETHTGPVAAASPADAPAPRVRRIDVA